MTVGYVASASTSVRRARLLRFLAPWTAPGGGYEVRVGHLQLPVGVLSGDALEDLASRIVVDFWAHRRRVRLNRLLHAATPVRPNPAGGSGRHELQWLHGLQLRDMSFVALLQQVLHRDGQNPDGGRPVDRGDGRLRREPLIRVEVEKDVEVARRRVPELEIEPDAVCAAAHGLNLGCERTPIDAGV